jgi:WD40 repeat protein
MLELRAGDAAVTSLAFAPSGRLLVTGDKEHAVRIWAVSTGRALPDGFDADAEFKSDGSLTGVGYDGRVASWDPSGDRKPKKQGRLESVGYHTELAPEGDTVASLEWRGRGRLTVASIDGRERRALNAESFALSDDGTRVLLLGTRRPRLVDPARKAATVRFGRFPSPVYVGALSRDGSEVLLGKRIFDADSPKQSVTLKGRVGYGGAFSPDGTRLVTTGREARVWNTETGKREARLDGHVGDVFTARYSPDGTRIVTGGADRTVRIWDSTTFEELGVIKGFGSELIQAKLDWEGRRLLVETIYDMPELVECTPCLDAEELAQRAETHVTRDLTPHELEEAGLAR